MLPIAFLFVILSVCFADNGLTRCDPPSGQPNCVCHRKYGVVDLTKIALNDGNPRFINKDLSYGRYSYDYNPCYGFSIGNSVCANGDTTAICQAEHTVVSPIESEEMFYDADDNYQLHYSGGDEDRKAIVYLHCNETATDPIITTLGDSEQQFLYIFDLYTNLVCLKSPNEHNSSASGYIGFILIFLSLVLLVTYFIVGIVILKFYRKEKGTKIIPNKNFWFNLPFLVKDGIKFAATPLIRLKYRDYKPISGINKA